MITNWKVSPTEMQLIRALVQRAEKLGIVTEARKGCKRHSGEYNRLTCDMDITACHLNGTPLDLLALSLADDFTFTHDICGIARHINRETGQLEDCFVPRCSAMK